MATTQSTKYVTSGEAARLLGVHPQSLTRRVRAGHLTHHRDGSDLRVRLIDQAEIERLLTPVPMPRREEAETVTSA